MPPYSAVMVCVPGARALVATAATLLDIRPVPNMFVPFLKLIVPVAPPAFVPLYCNVPVKVTLLRDPEGLSDASSFMAVASGAAALKVALT